MDATKILDELESIREEAHCSKVEDKETLMRKVLYEYKDTVLRGFMKGADVNFYTRLSDWRAELDPPALTQFIDDLQGSPTGSTTHLSRYCKTQSLMICVSGIPSVLLGIP